METTLILVRHGATEANLAKPARLQGQTENPPLAPAGVRQAEATRDLLAGRPIAAIYTSPLTRARQTADIIAGPHRLDPVTVEAIIECDVGRWAGRSWEQIQAEDSQAYRLYMSDPARHGYSGGESFGDVYERASEAFARIRERHPGQTILAVSHHVVNRTFLAVTLGLPLSEARRVSLGNCGVSIVKHSEDGTARVDVLNSTLHLS